MVRAICTFESVVASALAFEASAVAVAVVHGVTHLVFEEAVVFGGIVALKFLVRNKVVKDRL